MEAMIESAGNFITKASSPETLAGQLPWLASVFLYDLQSVITSEYWFERHEYMFAFDPVNKGN